MTNNSEHLCKCGHLKSIHNKQGCTSLCLPDGCYCKRQMGDSVWHIVKVSIYSTNFANAIQPWQTKRFTKLSFTWAIKNLMRLWKTGHIKRIISLPIVVGFTNSSVITIDIYLGICVIYYEIWNQGVSTMWHKIWQHNR